MKEVIVTTTRGEDFILTDDEVKYFNAIKRIAKMNPGRIQLFANGHLSLRINECWHNDEFHCTSIFCEGGDGGDNY